MALRKCVNNVYVDCTLEEETEILAEWAQNDPLDIKKRAKEEELQDAYQSAMAGGVVSSALGTPHFYATDGDRKTMLVGAYARSQIKNMNQPFYAVDAATRVGALKTHTPAQMAQVMDDAEAEAIKHLNHLQSKLAQVQTALSIVDVEAVVW